MKVSHLIGTCALLLSSIAAAKADVVVTFESFTDGDLLTNQIPNLTFQNAIVLSAGISLNDFEFPPFSGSNVISDNGGPISISFANPVLSFDAYLTYLQPVTLTAFNASNTLIATVVSAFGSNLAISGAVGSSPNELFSVSNAGGIKRLVVNGNSNGGSFVLDDAKIGNQIVSTVPEPSSFALTVVGALVGCGLLGRRRRFFSRN